MPSTEVMQAEGVAVPWALPNEEIPIRISWPKSFKFQEIRLELPDGFRFVEVLNARTKRVWKNQINVSGFIETSVGQSNYLGVIIKSKVIQSNIDETNKVVARFVQDNKVIYSIFIDVRTLRPKLELLKAPKKLEVSDRGGRISLPLEVKYSGFGDIRVNLVAKLKGQIISQGESLIYEVIRRLWEEKETPRSKQKRQKTEVDQAFVNNLTREVIERIESGNLSLNQIDEAAVNYLRDWFVEVGSENIRQILHARVENLLVGLLTDLVSRNPVSGVRLEEPRTKLVTRIQFPVNQITLMLKYRDVIGNSYQPVPITVTIENKKSSEGPIAIDIPVTFTRWQHEPILNVAGVD